MNKEIKFNDRNEWLAYRKSGIGASDSAIVLGLSKFKKDYDLFREKAGLVETQEFSSFATDRGNRLEPVARNKFAAHYNFMNDTDETFEPKNLEMTDHPFMRASLDGSSHDGKVIVEIKFQGKQAHEDVDRGIINPAYYCQIQHQLLVSGANRAFLVSIGDDETTIKSRMVLPDLAMQEEILERCADFWSKVLNKKWETETKEVSDIDLFTRWEQTVNEIKALEEIKDELQKQIYEKNIDVCGPFRVTTVERVGSINYSKIPAIQAMDPQLLDGYRGKGTSYKQIKRAKD